MHSSIVRHGMVPPRRGGRVVALVALASSAIVAVPLAAVASGAAAEVPVASVSFLGHGYGPGLGMGQWGDFGDAVRYHETYGEILDHFYGGTVSSSLAGSRLGSDPAISVAILENVNASGTVGYDPVVTSSSAFTVTGAGSTPPPPTTSSTTTTLPPTLSTELPTTSTSTTTTTSSTTTTLPPTSSTELPTTSTSTTTTTSSTTTTLPPGQLTIPAGMAIDLRLTKAGTWDVYESTSCGEARAEAGRTVPIAKGLVDPTVHPASTSPVATPASLLTLCRHDGLDEVVRGEIEAYDWLGYERTLNVLRLQSYLDGVVPAEESPSWGAAGTRAGAPQGRAWGFQALEAQAVASRSYAVAEMQAGGWSGYASICDTVCEAYVGENFESPLTDAAVADTLGVIRAGRSTDGAALTSYSASSGGWTAHGAFPAVPDPGDACVVAGNPFECNPNHTWRMTVPAALVERRFPAIGKLVGVTVTVRNRLGSFGGRVESVVVAGTESTMTVTGWNFAVAVRLLSDWFAVSSAG
jgi:peptidoglycan hydrolase-like amidase